MRVWAIKGNRLGYNEDPTFVNKRRSASKISLWYVAVSKWAFPAQSEDWGLYWVHAKGWLAILATGGKDRQMFFRAPRQQ